MAKRGYPGFRVEAQDGEIAGAATEVAYQHRRGFAKCAGEPGPGGLRLQRQGHLREARLGVGAAQTLGTQAVIRELAGEVHGAADDDARCRWDIGEECCEKAADQALQGEPVAEYAGLGKTPLRKVGLHRHDQAAVQRIFEVCGDRLEAGFVTKDAAGRRILGPEAENGTDDLQGSAVLRGHAAIIVQEGHNAVGGAEIDADRPDHPPAPRKGAGSSAIGGVRQGALHRLGARRERTPWPIAYPPSTHFVCQLRRR